MPRSRRKVLTRKIFVVRQLSVRTKCQAHVITRNVSGTVGGHRGAKAVRRRKIRLRHDDVVAFPHGPIGNERAIGQFIAAVGWSKFAHGLVVGIISHARLPVDALGRAAGDGQSRCQDKEPFSHGGDFHADNLHRRRSSASKVAADFIVRAQTKRYQFAG